MARKTTKPRPQHPIVTKPQSWRFTDWAML